MPHTAGPGPSPTGAWVIDPGWFGTVVVETEGTNEGLADLQARCRGAVIPRRGEQLSPEQLQLNDRRMVFRIVRERRYVVLYNVSMSGGLSAFVAVLVKYGSVSSPTRRESSQCDIGRFRDFVD